jgi:16S rRNA (uracil1498-N3)-methyltransferase
MTKRKKDTQRVMRRLFYAPPQAITKTHITLRDDEAYHVSTVLRLKKGDEFSVFDGEGNKYHVAFHEKTTTKEVIATILSKNAVLDQRPFSITLAQALPRKNKFDLIVEKATELGVSEIIPLITQHTEHPIAERNKEKVFTRWQKIILQTAKQSYHYCLPQLQDISSFEELCATYDTYTTVIIPAVNETKTFDVVLSDLKKAQHGSILIVIGPEGGFSPEEISEAVNKGAVPVSLGPTILKTDTAMIATIGILNAMIS